MTVLGLMYICLHNTMPEKYKNVPTACYLIFAYKQNEVYNKLGIRLFIGAYYVVWFGVVNAIHNMDFLLLTHIYSNQIIL